MAILAHSYQGISGGMNQAVPQHEIPDGQASYMQDIILSIPGIIKRRGPLFKVTGSATIPLRATGMAAVQDASGVYKVVAFAGNATHTYAYFYSADLTTVTGPYDLTAATGIVLDPANPRAVVDAKPALGGGTIIGISTGYLPSATTTAALMLWRGAVVAADIAVINCSYAGSTNVITTATAGGFNNVVPGMFVYDASSIIGVVKTVSSGTQILLEDTLPQGAFGPSTFTFRPFRAITPTVMKGRISVAAASRYINGTQGPAGTKFSSAQISDPLVLGASMDMRRLSTNERIIKLVPATTSLIDNATIDVDTAGVGNVTQNTKGMTNERYYIQQLINTYTLSITTGTAFSTGLSAAVGFLNCVWNGRQWYANRPLAGLGADLHSRVWFSDPARPDALDLAADDGDFMDIQSGSGPNTPIVAIQGIPAGLCVFKENELFLIAGSDYTNFSVRKVGDVGTLSTDSVHIVGAGVVFAGREGIFYFDGNALRNLGAQLGDYWTQSIRSFNSSTDRMGAYVWKNHYVLFIDNFASTYSLRKGAAVTTPTTVTFSINLDTFAITTFTNVAIKDSVTLPPGSGFNALILVDDGGTPGTSSLVDASNLHAPGSSGPDIITCGGQTLGPDFYIETKKYDLGDPERKKLFKQLAMNYILSGNTLSMDTVPGLNTTGTAINTAWATQATWTNLRKKFTKRDTHLQFRFYQTSSAVTEVRIGPFAIGFKLQRVGRV